MCVFLNQARKERKRILVRYGGVLLGQKSQGKGENNKGGVVWGSVKFGSMLLLFANSVNESYW
jgi:hypothetical protein